VHENAQYLYMMQTNVILSDSQIIRIINGTLVRKKFEGIVA
jgi:hypothetical protein